MARKRDEISQEMYDSLFKMTEEIKRMSENKWSQLFELTSGFEFFKDVRSTRLRNHIFSLCRDLEDIEVRIMKIQQLLEFSTIIKE